MRKGPKSPRNYLCAPSGYSMQMRPVESLRLVQSTQSHCFTLCGFMDVHVCPMSICGSADQASGLIVLHNSIPPHPSFAPHPHPHPHTLPPAELPTLRSIHTAFASDIDVWLRDAESPLASLSPTSLLPSCALCPPYPALYTVLSSPALPDLNSHLSSLTSHDSLNNQTHFTNFFLFICDTLIPILVLSVLTHNYHNGFVR